MHVATHRFNMKQLPIIKFQVISLIFNLLRALFISNINFGHPNADTKIRISILQKQL